KEYLNIILNETDRMKDLIEDMMSLSKIESGNEPLNKEHFNINDMLSRNLLAFEFEIEKKRLEINVNYEEDSLTVVADKAKIEQVVINLLQNAIKYTREGDKIIITTRQVKAKAYIEIMDTGIGIAKKDLENIFDRFYTVDKAKTPGKSGNGIGLSLVKKILELHESEIYAESEEGKYTKFYFYLDM
ncbi:MAG: ATP-binding protein, partial [Clostridia bacterium]|nr:ATP-binding protein [Clostridia bacterium]